MLLEYAHEEKQAHLELMHGCPDEPAQAEGDTGCQQAEQDLPCPGFPEWGAGGQAHARTDAEQAHYAERQADADGNQSISKDEGEDRDDGSDGEQEK